MKLSWDDCFRNLNVPNVGRRRMAVSYLRVSCVHLFNQSQKSMSLSVCVGKRQIDPQHAFLFYPLVAPVDTNDGCIPLQATGNWKEPFTKQLQDKWG